MESQFRSSFIEIKHGRPRLRVLEMRPAEGDYPHMRFSRRSLNGKIARNGQAAQTGQWGLARKVFSVNLN